MARWFATRRSVPSSSSPTSAASVGSCSHGTPPSPGRPAEEGEDAEDAEDSSDAGDPSDSSEPLRTRLGSVSDAGSRPDRSASGATGRADEADRAGGGGNSGASGESGAGGAGGVSAGGGAEQASEGGTLQAAVSFGTPRAAFAEGRLVRRLCQLYLGLLLYGTSMALMLRAHLGLNPWDVFHQGVATRTPLTFGMVVIAASITVMLAWIPLRQWPGLGTLSNGLLVGVVVDLMLLVLPEPESLPVRWGLLVGGVVLNAVATAAYIGARFGPGPRDGLMTGLVRRTGGSVRVVRLALEVVILAIGWLLGGTVGFGTLLYAVAIGPLTQAFLPRLTVAPRREEVAAGAAARRP